MFGYLKPDNPYLYLKDETLYKALYCGVCKSIGEICGQIPRFTLSYDMAFMSAICHNILGVDVEITKQRCIAHQIKKRPIQKPDEISLTLGAVNVILAYYKIRDDILDENKGLSKSLIIKKGYKKAKAKCPNIDKIVCDGYNRLREYETKNSSSVDLVCDAFAKIIEEISTEIFQEKSTEFTKNLFYAIGKWVYLIDALDDYDKDVKKKNFNVLYNEYKAENFATLLKNNKAEILYVFNSIFSQIAENYKNIKMKYNTDLVNNIITRGIPQTTNKILQKGIKND